MFFFSSWTQKYQVTSGWTTSRSADMSSISATKWITHTHTEPALTHTSTVTWPLAECVCHIIQLVNKPRPQALSVYRLDPDWIWTTFLGTPKINIELQTAGSQFIEACRHFLDNLLKVTSIWKMSEEKKQLKPLRVTFRSGTQSSRWTEATVSVRKHEHSLLIYHYQTFLMLLLSYDFTLLICPPSRPLLYNLGHSCGLK